MQTCCSRGSVRGSVIAEVVMEFGHPLTPLEQTRLATSLNSDIEAMGNYYCTLSI